MSIDTEDEKKETNDGGTIAPYVSKVLNNTHYNFIKDNNNFAEIVNMSLGFKLVDPETLVDCDSREIALAVTAAYSFSGVHSGSVITLHAPSFSNARAFFS